MSPEKMLTISGADRFSRRGGHLPTTRDIYKPIVYHLEIAGGIVKHGSAIGRVLKRTGAVFLYRGKAQDEVAERDPPSYRGGFLSP